MKQHLKELLSSLANLVFLVGYAITIIHWVAQPHPTTKDAVTLIFYTLLVIGAEVRDAVKKLEVSTTNNFIIHNSGAATTIKH